MTNNWQLKLTAVAIAFLLWLGVQGERPYLYRMTHVPVRVRSRDAEWVVSAPPSPATVSLELHAPFRDLLHLSAAKPVVVIPVDDVTDTAAIFALRAAWVDLGPFNGGVQVGRIAPATVRVSFDRLATRLVSLHARFTGKLDDTLEIAGEPIIDPPVVRASGPANRLARMNTIELPHIDVRGMNANDTVILTIDTTGTGALITPLRARVVLPIRRKVR